MKTRHIQPFVQLRRARRVGRRWTPPVRGGARKLMIALALLAAIVVVLTVAGYWYGDGIPVVAPIPGREAPVQ